MSRSGFTGEWEPEGVEDVLRYGRKQGALMSAVRGKRGQALLRAILEAFDAMPEKKLGAGALVAAEGDFCTLGTVAAKYGVDSSAIPEEDWDEAEWETLAKAFNVTTDMIREIVWLNDGDICGFKMVSIEICGPVRPWYPEYGQHILKVEAPRDPDDIARERWRNMREQIERWLTPKPRRAPRKKVEAKQ